MWAPADWKNFRSCLTKIQGSMLRCDANASVSDIIINSDNNKSVETRRIDPFRSVSPIRIHTMVFYFSSYCSQDDLYCQKCSLLVFRKTHGLQTNYWTYSHFSRSMKNSPPSEKSWNGKFLQEMMNKMTIVMQEMMKQTHYLYLWRKNLWPHICKSMY